MADIIQVNYEQLEEINKRFEQQAEDTRQVYQRLYRVIENLENGGWQGEGSQAFFKEVNDEVFPALQRLSGGLDESGQKTGQISKLFLLAEEESQSLSSGASPVLRGSGASMGMASFMGGIWTASKDFGVNAKETSEYDWAFRGKRGERFKKDIEWAAKEVGVDPGLLAASLIAETRRSHYLSKEKASSFLIGTDDFFDKRGDIKERVPAYSKIGWDENQEPYFRRNEKGRNVKTIDFDSGRDSLLASAVYLKHGEEVLREEAVAVGKDFDKLPVDTRFALTRLAFNAGLGRAKKNLREVFAGKDVLIRNKDAISGPQRKATIRTAQALHFSEKIFGVTPR